MPDVSVTEPVAKVRGLTAERTEWLKTHPELSHRDAAQALGVSTTTIARWRALVGLVPRDDSSGYVDGTEVEVEVAVTPDLAVRDGGGDPSEDSSLGTNEGGSVEKPEVNSTDSEDLAEEGPAAQDEEKSEVNSTDSEDLAEEGPAAQDEEKPEVNSTDSEDLDEEGPAAQDEEKSGGHDDLFAQITRSRAARLALGGNGASSGYRTDGTPGALPEDAIERTVLEAEQRGVTSAASGAAARVGSTDKQYLHAPGPPGHSGRKRYMDRMSRWLWARVGTDEAWVAGKVVGNPEVVPVVIENSTLYEVRVMIDCERGRSFRVSGIVARSAVGQVSVSSGPGVGMERLEDGTFCQFVGTLEGSPLRLGVRQWRLLPNQAGVPENRLVLTGRVAALNAGKYAASQEATIDLPSGSKVRVLLPEGHIVAPGTPVVAIGRPPRPQRSSKSVLPLVSIRLDERQFQS